MPKAFDERVGKVVAEAVAEAAKKSGVARIWILRGVFDLNC